MPRDTCRICFQPFTRRADRPSPYCRQQCRKTGDTYAATWRLYLEGYVYSRNAISRFYLPDFHDPLDRMRIGVTGRHYRRIDSGKLEGMWEEIKSGEWDHRTGYTLARRLIVFDGVVPPPVWDADASRDEVRPVEGKKRIDPYTMDQDISPMPGSVVLWGDPYRYWDRLKPVPADTFSLVDIDKFEDFEEAVDPAPEIAPRRGRKKASSKA